MPRGSEAEIWPGGRECAVTLAYCSATPEHLALLSPFHDSTDFRATFFLNPTNLLDDPAAWKEMSGGNEIGNHCLHDVTRGGSLLNWTFDMVEQDVKESNDLIAEITGARCRSFALPGWSTACAEGDYHGAIRRLNPYVASERREANDWKSCDLGYVGTFPLEQINPATIIDQARKDRGWVVFRIANIDDALRRVLETLEFAAQDLWVAPFGDVADRIASLQRTLELKP